MSKNKTILITGTSKGIGNFLCRYYSDTGMNVIGCSRSNLNIKSINYTHYKLDICNEEKVKEMFHDIRIKHGSIDILINNAGIASMNHIMLTPVKTLEKIFETNFYGMFLMCREAAKLMKKNRSGRIINMSSVAVSLNLEGEAIYASSKSALVTFTKILSKELSEFGITVNSIGLTPVDTDLIKNVPKEKIIKLIDKLTIKRFTEFSDISNLTDFLIKDESCFITGQNINFGGV